MESKNFAIIGFIQSEVKKIAEGMRVPEFVAFQRLKHLLLTNPETKDMIPEFLEMVSVYENHMELVYGSMFLKLSGNDAKFIQEFLYVNDHVVKCMLETESSLTDLTKYNDGMLSYIMERTSWDTTLSDLAIHHNKVLVLKWLCNNDCPVEVKTAAELGRFDVLNWFYEQYKFGYYKFQFSESTMAGAAACGNVAVMKWLHEKNVSMGLGTTVLAAKNGHLEALKFAHTHKSLRYTVAKYNATKHNHQQILDWLKEIKPT